MLGNVVELLDEQAVAAGIAGTGWSREGDALVREIDCGDFAGSLGFVNRVGALAEARNHHPDIAISWRKVTLTLSTHSAGGITQADLDLAAAIDDLATPA